MPEAPLPRHDASQLPDLDSKLQMTHDERSRARIASTMLNHAMMNLRFQVWDAYKTSVEPEFVKQHGRPAKTGKEIARAIKNNPFYQTYSAFRYNVQEMGTQSAIDAVERAAPALNAAWKEAEQIDHGIGSLRLNPSVEIPNYMSSMDAHLSPGGYYTERVPGDITQAMLFQSRKALGPNVNPIRDFGGVGLSVGTWVKRRFPDLKPRRILDLATQEGKQIYAYHELFPDAELYGVDIAAPSLRYGHLQAARKGVAIHFSQQNAEKMDFPDGYFDLIVSSFFLHEISVPATRNVTAECYRLLAPGGVLAHMELPPSKMVEPLLDFTFNWDCRNNNEPHYAHYRAQDPTKLAVDAGFKREHTFELEVPQVSSFPKDKYEAFLHGEVKAPPHGRGGWFVWGARKV